MAVPQKMMGYKCDGCSKIYYPKRARCPKCKSRSFKEIPLSDEATVLTYTKLYAIPRGVDEVPLTLVIVEFKEGTRALGQLTTRDVDIGMKVRPVWGQLRRIDDKPVFGFRFEPIK